MNRKLENAKKNLAWVLTLGLCLAGCAIQSRGQDDDATTGGAYTSGIGKKGQLDRVGLPGVNFFFISYNQQDGYNIGSPVGDLASWTKTVVENLQGYGVKEAEKVPPIIFPDLLSFDPARANGFPNGRQLSDDVGNWILKNFTASYTTDRIDANDKTFLSEFPYLAEPH